MKRVNTVALYEFEAEKSDEKKPIVKIVYLVLPDVGGCGKNYMYCGKENGYYSNVDGARYYKYSDYKYESSFKPISELENYNAFIASNTQSVDHAFLFSKKNNRLIAEWFRVPSLKTNLSIVYDNIEVFHHDVVDDAFDLEVKNHTNYLVDSELALSSKCVQDVIPEDNGDGDSGFTVSASWLLIAFVIFVLSFTQL